VTGGRVGVTAFVDRAAEYAVMTMSLGVQKRGSRRVGEMVVSKRRV